MFLGLGKKLSRNRSNRAADEELLGTTKGSSKRSVCKPAVTDTATLSKSKGVKDSSVLASPIMPPEKSIPANTTSGTLTATTNSEPPVKEEQQQEEEPHGDEGREGSENKSRTVNDFRTQEELKTALCSSGANGSCRASETAWLFAKDQAILNDLLASNKEGTEQCMECDNNNTTTDVKELDQRLDWILENYHEATTQRQSISHELRRLLVLKSFLVLDTERQEAFDQVTSLASERFGCPIAVISFVDLGRQWFLSAQGVGEIRETPRKLSFCAHTIMSTQECLVVPDATKDVRFQNNPLVTGPPDIRFYAGAPLLAPEGYKLGTLCVLDTKARDPLTKQDEADLVQLAATTMSMLLDHRRKMSLWFNNLVSTHYPDFEVDDEDVESVSHLEQQDGKEDSAVCDFRHTTEHMPLADILSVLEDEAKAKNVSLDYLKDYTAIAELEDKRPAKSNRQTKVRFAEDESTGELRLQVHPVECWKDMKDMWWNPQEMVSIRAENRRVASYFRRRRQDYVQNLEFVALYEEPQQVVADVLNVLVDDSYARGLEAHIVSLLSSTRQEAVRAVLDEQSQCHADKDDFNSICYSLREQLLLRSKLCTRFAEKMGQCDQLIATKASLASWGATSSFSPIVDRDRKQHPPCNNPGDR